MRFLRTIRGVAAGLGLAIAASLFAASGPIPAQAQNANRAACMTWSEARSTGMMKKFKMRPASEIKAQAEVKYGGKVVSFQICKRTNGLVYRLAVFRPDGNVVFVTEPAQ